MPPPRRLRARTPSDAPLVPTTVLQPLLSAQRQVPVQLLARALAMDEVAEAAPAAPLAAVQAETTARFSEVGDGRQLAVYGARRVPARVELIAGLLGGVFVLETGVDVADQILFTLANHFLLGTSLRSNFYTSAASPGGDSLRSLLLSQTTNSSTSPYLQSSHQMSS